MREKILSFIEKNSRIDLKELAILLGEDEIDVMNEIGRPSMPLWRSRAATWWTACPRM